MNETFPEDSLPLLGPEIRTLNAQAFYDRICSLYSEKAKGAKAPKAPKLRGKITQKLTKKSVGIYEINFLAQETKATFVFDKTKTLTDAAVTRLAGTLRCAEELINAFLTIKKFSVVKERTLDDLARPSVEASKELTV